MRMWMINPRLLCKNHLLGEHSEIHKHRHIFIKQHSTKGRDGQIEPLAMKKRHDELAEEMLRRGWKHNSPYEQPNLDHLSDYERNSRVDILVSVDDLKSRCSECRRKIKKFTNNFLV